MFRAIFCSSSGGQNCIFTASGIVILCERPCSTPVHYTCKLNAVECSDVRCVRFDITVMSAPVVIDYKQDRKCTYELMLCSVRVTTVAVEKQQRVLFVLLSHGSMSKNTKISIGEFM
jgi:hypothetical protein